MFPMIIHGLDLLYSLPFLLLSGVVPFNPSVTLFVGENTVICIVQFPCPPGVVTASSLSIFFFKLVH